jgi:transcriptional regulator with XRE-family HTH domain
MTAKRTETSERRTNETLEDLRELFGVNFRHARQKAKLTQTDVQELTGIRQHYISEIENGVQNLTLSTMVTLAGAVGTDVSALFRRPAKPR